MSKSCKSMMNSIAEYNVTNHPLGGDRLDWQVPGLHHHQLPAGGPQQGETQYQEDLLANPLYCCPHCPHYSHWAGEYFHDWCSVSDQAGVGRGEGREARGLSECGLTASEKAIWHGWQGITSLRKPRFEFLPRLYHTIFWDNTEI